MRQKNESIPYHLHFPECCGNVTKRQFSTVVFNTNIKNDLSSFYKKPSRNGGKILLSNKAVSLEESFRIYDAVKTKSMVDLKILVELIGKC